MARLHFSSGVTPVGLLLGRTEEQSWLPASQAHHRVRLMMGRRLLQAH
jgi:hypothetical protein